MCEPLAVPGGPMGVRVKRQRSVVIITVERGDTIVTQFQLPADRAREVADAILDVSERNND